MVEVSTLFIVLYAIMLLWLTPNAIVKLREDRFFLTPAFGTGKSMEPAIPRGLTTYIEYYPVSIDEGDIVAYTDEHGRRICHRVIAVDNDKVEIKGDNNDWSDGWYHTDDITGKIWCPRGVPLYLPLSPASLKRAIEG